MKHGIVLALSNLTLTVASPKHSVILPLVVDASCKRVSELVRQGSASGSAATKRHVSLSNDAPLPCYLRPMNEIAAKGL